MPDHVSPVEFFLDFIDELKESGAGVRAGWGPLSEGGV